MSYVYLDTETTGLGPDARIVEVAIVDDEGHPLVNTLVNPGIPIPPEASAVHGITDADVADAPTLEQIMPAILAAVTSRHLVIYNAAYDIAFFPCGLSAASDIECAMLDFAELYGDWNPDRGQWRWQRLTKAAAHVGHVWSGSAHRALADALACRSVWHWILAQQAANHSQEQAL